jgi:SAM-dependent methyltransferase
MTTLLCDLCSSPQLESVYEPEGTVRGSVVHLCQNCGMLQSVFSNPTAKLAPSISAGPEFGGIRTGKIQRAKPNLQFIASAFGDDRPARVLDVGASRGAFVRELLDWSPDVMGMAIEPDTSVWPSDLSNSDMVWKPYRVEDMNFFNNVYDLCYMSHTLEHLNSPRATLLQLYQALAPDGLLFIEVPDMGAIAEYEDGVEEMFLDRHTHHFTWATLHTLLEAAGFRGVEGYRDGENMTILARKADPIPVAPDPVTVQINRELIDTYRANRQRNLALLPHIAGAWNELATEKRVVVWGIGRLFSALVGAGLDTEEFEELVDINAKTLRMLPVNEIPPFRVVITPEELAINPPDLIMACSRTSQDEIKAQARELLGKEIQVIGWDEV